MKTGEIHNFIRTLHRGGRIVELRRLPAGRSSWFDSADTAGIARAADASNAAGQNIYVGANPRAAMNARGDASIREALSLFVDFDGKHLTATSRDAIIAEALQRIADAGLPRPSIIVWSGHGLHTYWPLLEPLTDLTLWARLTDDLITVLGSDAACSNLERIMRLPGTLNLKGEPMPCELIECSDYRHDLDEIAERLAERVVTLHPDLIGSGAPEDPDIAAAIDQHADRVRAGASVIDAFNARVSLRDLLASHGYNIVGGHFRRPGKDDRSFSGILRTNKHGTPVVVSFSTNDVLNDRKFKRGACGIHDAFGAFALLTHGGNYTAAVRDAAARLGIEKPKQKRDADVIREIQAGGDADEFARLWFVEFYAPRCPSPRSRPPARTTSSGGCWHSTPGRPFASGSRRRRQSSATPSAGT